VYPERIYFIQQVKSKLMKRRVFLPFLFVFMSVWSYGQLVNNGATLTIKDGAKLVVDNDVDNLTGSIVLEGTGTLEISGDLDNQGTFTAADDSTVKFYGSNDGTVTSNGAEYGHIILDKTASNLILGDDLILKKSFTFEGDDNLVILGSNDFILRSTGSMVSYDENEFFQADGTGTLTWEVPSAGSYIFPVGNEEMSNKHYSPLTVDFTASNIGANGSIEVNVVDEVHPQLLTNYADASPYLSRYWEVSTSNITDFAADLTGEYVDGDVTYNGAGSEDQLTGVSYSTEFSFQGTAGDDLNNLVTASISDNSGDLTGVNFYGSLDITAFLQGPYTSGSMTTSLNGILPLVSPYDAGVSVASIPNGNIVDWIKIEARDSGDPSSVIESYSKFILNDGQIVDLDGSSTPKFKDAP
jgi:hypothetical protein